MKFEIDRARFPFRSRFMTLEGGARLHYVDEGVGPVLLLLHGNPTWSFLYRKIIANLRPYLRCVALDYPGFGLSTAPGDYSYTPAEHSAAVAEFIQRLDLRDITIMVQDWGGPIGFDVALRHVERVREFVIGNTWAWPVERIGQQLISRLMGGLLGRTATWGFNGATRLFLWKGVATPLEGAVRAMYLAPFRERRTRSTLPSGSGRDMVGDAPGRARAL